MSTEDAYRLLCLYVEDCANLCIGQSPPSILLASVRDEARAVLEMVGVVDYVWRFKQEELTQLTYYVTYCHDGFGGFWHRFERMQGRRVIISDVSPTLGRILMTRLRARGHRVFLYPLRRM